MNEKLYDFLVESDKIEGIYLPFPGNIKAWEKRLEATTNFIELHPITIPALRKIVKIFEPMAELRDKEGLNVFVGGYYPPKGGKDIGIVLQKLLISMVEEELTPFKAHNIYESLHPFTDCNGRSGRLIWLWQMIHQGHGWPELGFLHTWYYQSLQHIRANELDYKAIKILE